MTSKKRKVLSLSPEAGADTARDITQLTEKSLTSFAESLVNFERARSDCRSGVTAHTQTGLAPQLTSLEDFKATVVGKSRLAIKSEQGA